MDWQAAWIWDGGEASPRNAWRCFRRSFALEAEGWDNALLSITADSRYALWVNGVFVGRGPARSWPFAQSYDSYEVGHLLRRDGPNGPEEPGPERSPLRGMRTCALRSATRCVISPRME